MEVSIFFHINNKISTLNSPLYVAISQFSARWSPILALYNTNSVSNIKIKHYETLFLKSLSYSVIYFYIFKSKINRGIKFYIVLWYLMSETIKEKGLARPPKRNISFQNDNQIILKKLRITYHINFYFRSNKNFVLPKLLSDVKKYSRYFSG